MTQRAAVGNAGDAEQVGRAKQKGKLARDRELDDMRALLSIPAGRRFLWGLMDRCNAFRSVFNSDPLAMAHAAGWQNVGHFVMDEIRQAKPDAFLTMMQENAPPQKAEPEPKETE